MECDRGCTPGYGHAKNCRAFDGEVDGIRYLNGAPDPFHVQSTAFWRVKSRLQYRPTRIHVTAEFFRSLWDWEIVRINREHSA